MVEPPPKDWRRPMQLVLYSDMDQPSGARRRGARRLVGLVRATVSVRSIVSIVTTTILQTGGLSRTGFRIVVTMIIYEMD